MSIDSLAEGWAKALSVDRKHFNMFFDGMMDGFAYHKIVVDEAGKPVDYMLLEVNKAFERMTGLKREKIIGKKVTEVIKGIENDPADWIGRFGKIALGCEPAQFESFAEPLQRWYSVSAYCPEKGYFVAIFEDITERKKAQEAMRTNEERFRSVLTNSPDVVYRFNVQTGRNEYMSPASQTMLGFAPEEMMAMTNEEVLSHVHPDDLPTLRGSLKRLNKIGKSVAEYRFKSKEGSYLWLSDQMVITKDKDGKPLYRDGFVRNVTDKKNAEESLKKINEELEDRVKKRTEDIAKERQRLYNVLETLPSYVVLLDENYGVPFANKVFRETFGESKGRPCYEFLFHRDSPCPGCETFKVLKTKKPHRWEWTGPNGRDYDIYDFPFPEADGETLILEMGVDITERKRNEAELKKYREHLEELVAERTRQLQESEQRWAVTLSSIGDAVIASDTDGKITFINGTAEELTGWTLKEAVGKPVTKVFNIINEATRKKVENPITKVLERGCVVGLANHTLLKRKNGVEIPIDDSGAPIKTSDGKTIGVVLVFRDMTERKKAEENLLKLNRTLRAISDSNQALLRATDEKSFLEQACKIIVEDCGYKMVWVGLAENDEAKTVRPVAYAGFDEGYIESLNITWANTERGQGPTGRAIRTGKPQFCENMRTDPSFKTWREEALKRGYASSIALPLISGNKVLGALMLYSTKPNVCSKDEIKLLNELANDFAHGVNMLRLRREKELAEDQIHRQANLIDLSPDAIIVRKFDETINFWSKGAEKLYGWTKKEAIGKTTHELFQTKYPRPFQEIVAELKRSKRWTGELTHKTKNGSEVIVQSWWLAEKTERGEIKTILESNVDLTERKRNENEIARLASFPTLNPSPIIEVDASGRLTYHNPATNLLFPDLEDLGLKHPFFSGWKRLVKTFDDKATNTFGREVKIGGCWYYQQLYLVPLTQHIRIYATDVDELKRSEEARIKAQEKLEENAVLLEEYASQMEQLAEQRAQQLKDSERLAAIGQTASMVGHDIRNPLQAITGDIYLIAEEARTLPQNDNTKAILESVEGVNENLAYIDKIIRDLQDYTRPLRPTFQDVDLADIIHGTLVSVNVPKHIDVRINVAANAEKIKTDPAYIRRALTNLFNNAVQAMPTEGKLTVNATRKKETIIVTVEDTGGGIPLDSQEKLFTPLFTTKAKGQGLGLSVVKRLVEALGGKIAFVSEENKGTKFIINLPQQKSTVEGKP